MVPRLGLRVGAVGLGGPVEQQRQIPAREREPGQQFGIGITATTQRRLGAMQLAQRALEVAGGRAHVRQITAHRRDVGRGSRDFVDRQRRRERRDGARVVAAIRSQQPDVVPHLGGAGAIVLGAVQGEGLAVAAGGGFGLPGKRGEVAEIDEVDRRRPAPAHATVRRQRRLERASRADEIPERLGDQTAVVLVRREAARVPGADADRSGPGVQRLRLPQLAAILMDAGEIADRVAGGADVAAALGQLHRARPVRLRTVQLAQLVEALPDVPQPRRDPRRVADPRRASHALPPQPHGGDDAALAERLITGQAQAVRRHFRAPPDGRPRSESGDLPQEERVAPRGGVRGREVVGG